MNFSIAELGQLSGISAHTIRMWERRYGALKPSRSAGNTRLYNDDQLRRLLNIASLTGLGLKISGICAMTDKEMVHWLQIEISKTISLKPNFEFYISQLIAYGLRYNERGINELLDECIRDYEMTDTYKNVIYPLLVRLGLMWRVDQICPAQEHFLSCIIKQKLFAAIDKLPVRAKNKQAWMLFLPEDEDHEMGLLFANYMLRLHGFQVIYLGPKVPLHNLINVVKDTGVQKVLLFMIRLRKASEAEKYISRLNSIIYDLPVYLAGNSAMIGEMKLAANTMWLRSIEDFEQILNKKENGH